VTPVYCHGNPSKCITGAKQPIIYNQLDGNNVIIPPGVDVGYNDDWGFTDGAQLGIFEPGSGPQNSTLGTTTGAQNLTLGEVSPNKAPKPHNGTLGTTTGAQNLTLGEVSPDKDPRPHNGTLASRPHNGTLASRPHNGTLGTTTGAQNLTLGEVSPDKFSGPKNVTLAEDPNPHNGTYEEGCKASPSAA